MANKVYQNVVTGTVLNFVIGDIAVGLIQTGDGRRGFGTEAVHGMGGLSGSDENGSFMPQEHVQLRYDGTFTIDKFYIRNNDLAKLGLAALGSDILSLGLLNVEVKDVAGNLGAGKVIRTYQNCTVSDYTETFRSGAIAGENATLHYMSCVESV